jgi:PAS domain S-box-containing protein
MVDIVLEVFRAVVLLGAVIFLWAVGRNRFETSADGWKLIVGGFVLLLFGSLLDITDNFESLNGYIVIGDTKAEAFLEKVVGFLGGFALLSIGLVRWMPRVQFLAREVSQRKQAEEELRKARDELEARVEERTAKLKTANEALQESEALFRAFVDNLPVEIFIRDADGRFVLVNRAWERAQDLSSEEAIGKTPRDIFPMDRADAFIAQDDVVLKTGQVLDREIEFQTRDKSLFLRTIKFPIPDVKGDTTAVGGIAVDITERKRAEAEIRQLNDELECRVAERTAALHESEARYRAVVEDQTELICRFLPDGTLVFVNEAYCRYHGKKRGDLVGQKFVPLMPEEDREGVEQLLASLGSERPVATHQHRVIPRDGGVRWQHWVNRAILDSQGNITEFQAVGHDVTELKQAEEALRQAQDELLRRERLATLGRLTATVSHELRNPLGTIRASISLLRGGLEKGATRAWGALDRVERSVIRCDRIIDELLDYTRIQDLELELTPIETWMSEVLDEQTIPSDIRLRQEFHLPGVIASFDRDRLRRAVINVLDNACQAMTGEVGAGMVETEPTLTVRTNQVNGRIEMIIEDSGPGIPPDLATKIFEPMFSTKSFGVGLGLPVANQIMEQHDGGIEIESEDGRGTKVCLWLPGSRYVQEDP